MRLAALAAAAAATLLAASAAEAKAVFAHYMVGNVREFSQGDWEADIRTAQAAGLDGFALNVAAGDGSIPGSVAKGFAAADALGGAFKLFFSFDYLGGGQPWLRADVVDMVNAYKDRPSYYHHQAAGRPLVSTFEGTTARDDWPAIKTATGAFFVPDWDSMGPEAAVATGVVDGLFNWDAWPTGAADKTTDKDEAYRRALGPGRPYMMGVSPWFFANVYDKNWLWRGDDLWFDRWQQVLALQPELVEIITWNDYGESHYIGPLYASQFGLFEAGGAPYNYAADMPHDGWRRFLPYLIRQYKTGGGAAGVVDAEGLTAWYRRSPAAACRTGGTTGNDAGHGQAVLAPGDVVRDRVFFSALLRSPADAYVAIGGGAARKATWTSVPAGGSGLYHGSAPFDGRTGAVVVTVSRDGDEIARVAGASIGTDSCTDGITNWNAWVGSSDADPSASPPPSDDPTTTTTTTPPADPTTTTTPPTDGACVAGAGNGNFGGLCSFACGYDYCPAPCTCTRRAAAAVAPPPATGEKGYPRVGVEDHCAYLGLCSFAWDRGYTDNRAACGDDPAGADGCRVQRRRRGEAL